MTKSEISTQTKSVSRKKKKDFLFQGVRSYKVEFSFICTKSVYMCVYSYTHSYINICTETHIQIYIISSLLR